MTLDQIRQLEGVPVEEESRTTARGRRSRVDAAVPQVGVGQALATPFAPPSPVADPTRDANIRRLSIMGLAYAPGLTNIQANAVAGRLYDWSRDDPALRSQLFADFEGVVTGGLDVWSQDSMATDFWTQTQQILGEAHAERQRQQRMARFGGYDPIYPGSSEARYESSVVGASKSTETPGFWQGFGSVFGAIASGAGKAMEGAGGLVGNVGEQVIERNITVGPINPATMSMLGWTGLNAELRDQNAAREAARSQAAMFATPERALALMATSLSETQDLPLEAASSTVFLAFDALSPDEQSEFLRSVEEMTGDELVRAFDETLDTDTEGNVARGITSGVWETAAIYDTAIHSIGAELVDEIVEMSGGDVDNGPISELIQNGPEAAREAWEDMREGGLAGHYGIEGDAATWMNLGSSIAFDPVNWFTGGGRSATAQWRHAMTSPQGLDSWLTTTHNGSRLVKTLAETDNAWTVMVMGSGMDEAAMRAIRETTDPDVVREVIRQQGTDGLWMANAHNLTQRHRAALGLGELGQRLADAGDSRVADKIGETIDMLMGRTNHRRMVSVGDSEFVNNMSELLIHRFRDTDPATRGRLNEWAERIWGSMEDYRAGNPQFIDERRVATESLQNTIQGVRDELRTPTLQHMTAARGVLDRAPGELLDLRSQLDLLDPELTDDITRLTSRVDELESAQTLARQMVDQNGEAYDQLLDRMLDAERSQAELQSLIFQAGIPGSRVSLQATVDEFMEDWALDIVGRRNLRQFTTESGQVNWSAIRQEIGLTPSSIQIDEGVSASSLDPFGAAKDEAAELGLGVQSSQVPLPLSPQEMVLFDTLAGHPHLAAIRQAGATRVAMTAFHGFQKAWASMVLLNPRTILKSNVDEPLTFMSEVGLTRSSLKAHMTTFGVGSTNEYAQAFARRVVGGLESKPLRYDLIPNPKMATARGTRTTRARFFEAAQRFGNQNLMGDPAVRLWAEAYMSGDATRFVDWWNRAGDRARVNMVAEVRPARGIPQSRFYKMTGGQYYESMTKMMETFIKQTGDADLFDELVKVLSDPTATALPAKVVRRLPFGFGEARGRTDALGRMFDATYAAPSGRRGAVFFEHYHDQALDAYLQRFGWGTPNSRILDDPVNLDRMVQSGVAPDVATARQMIRIGDEASLEFAQSRGLVTRGRLETQAAAYAADHAESLMYTQGVSSVAGRAAKPAAPFVGAFADFMRRWGGRLTTTQEVGLFHGETRNWILRQAEALGPEHRAVAAGLNFAARQGSVPVNTRLLARYAHLIAEEARTSDEAGLTNPIGFLRAFTFIPLDWNDGNVLIDLVPGLGPLPQWMIGMLPEDDPRRQALADIFPALQYLEGQYEKTIESALTALIPSSRGSLANLAGAGLRLGGLADKIGLSSPVLGLDALPYAYWDGLKAEIGAELARDPNLTLPSNTERISEIHQSVLAATSTEEGIDRIQRWAGFNVPYGSDGGTLNTYQGIVDNLDMLFEAEAIGAPQRDEVRELWDRLDELTTPEKEHLADSLASMLFDMDDAWRDYLIATNPALATNMTSTIRCNVDSATGASKAPEEYCRPDGRVNNAHPDLRGQRGYETRAKGFRNDWFVQREPVDVINDVYYAVSSARTRQARRMFASVMGRDWASSSNLPQSMENGRVTLTDEDLALWESIGVTSMAPSMTGGEFRRALSETFQSWPREELSIAGSPFWQSISRFHAQDIRLRAEGSEGEEEQGFALFEEYVAEAETELREQEITSFYDWPEDYKQWFRDTVGTLAALEPEILQEYNRHMLGAFGPLDWDPPVPPPTSKLDVSFDVTPERLAVIDGDTIAVRTADDLVRVRIVGLNTPEQGQTGYSEARAGLDELLASASNVTIGVYDPSTFGTSQTVDADGTKRLFAWLYVDGTPLYDPSVFTATTPSGAGVGGGIPDYAALLDASKRRLRRRVSSAD